MSHKPGRIRQLLPKISIKCALRPGAANAQGLVPVRWVARWHGQELFGAPGELVNPGLWDKAAGRVTRKHERHVHINANLTRWEKKIDDAFWKHAGADGHQFVSKAAMEAELFPPPAQDPDEHRPIAGRLLTDVNSVWQAENGQLEPDTLRKYEQVLKVLEEWRPGLRAQDIDERLAKQYLQHLLSLDFSNATIARHFLFLRVARAQVGLSVREGWLKHAAQNATQLDLDRAEVQALLNVKLLRDDLRIERDTWLLQMFCGRRVNDMEDLNPAQLTRLHLPAPWGEVTAINHVQRKTVAEVVVPLPAIAVEIGNRYDWQLPPVSQQERGRRIKEVAARAHLKRLFMVRHFSGRVVTEEALRVSEIISPKTARHTCAALLKRYSVVDPSMPVDKTLAKVVLGHADEDTTDIYSKEQMDRVGPLILAAWDRIIG